MLIIFLTSAILKKINIDNYNNFYILIKLIIIMYNIHIIIMIIQFTHKYL